MIAPRSTRRDCTSVGDSIERLDTKAATSGGTVSAPQAGDPIVHTRSFALDDRIGAATTSADDIHCRDAIVLGGCPSASTFDTVQALWIP